MGRYNPDSKPLNKGKQSVRMQYEKGQFAPDNDKEFLFDIIMNGGMVEVRAEGMMENGASFCELRIFYIHPNANAEKENR